MTGIKPLGENLLVREIEGVAKERKTKGGIILTAQSEEDKMVNSLPYGEVIDISEEIEDSGIKVGDMVLYDYAKRVLTQDSTEEYRIVKLSDVLCKYEAVN